MPPKKWGKKFGDRVRALRRAEEFGLREFAKKMSMSPTYLSRVERGEVPPPAEKKVVAIAQALGQNPDELMALAGRVPSELREIILQNPKGMADFLRTAKSLSPGQIKKLTEQAKKRTQSNMKKKN